MERKERLKLINLLSKADFELNITPNIKPDVDQTDPDLHLIQLQFFH